MNTSLRPVVMRYLRYTFLGLALAFSNRALEAQACRSGDDTASNFVDDVTMKVTAVDSDEVASRTYLGMPAASASTVSLVTDERTCQKALSAYNTARPQNSTAVAGSVYVVKAGSGSSIVYVVRTVPSNESEFTRVNVFDSKWKLLGGYGG